MKTFISIIITITGIFIFLSLPLYANAEENQHPDRFGYSDFTEYLMITDAMAESEEYPHFLELNAKRYEDYRSANPGLSFDLIIAYVNAFLDKEPYEDVQPVPDPYNINVLVNKMFNLPPDWAPDDMVDLGGRHMLREEAAENFLLMKEAMLEDGLNLVIIATHRSYNTQRNHYNNAVAAHGLASADAGFARPGHSEHQTGLAADILHRAHQGGLMMNQGFENSKQFTWLLDNAHNYGFILRYPQNYRNLSGFIFEPWHWRYVGIPVATAMYDKEIVLYEEFYGRYLAQGIQDKVNEFIMQQQAIADAEEAVRIEREIFEAEEAARIAAQQAEEAIKTAAQIIAAEHTAAIEAAISAARSEAEIIANELAVTEKAVRDRESAVSGRHLTGLFLVLILFTATSIMYIMKKKNTK